MMNFKKLVSLSLSLVMLTLLLSGCHGATQRNTFVCPEEFDEEKQYEITFWAKNDTNKTQTDIYKKAIADFEDLYPNITVNLKLYTDYGRIYNDVITNISTNTTPNVCITYPDHIATYITGQNSVVPLDQLMVNEKYGLGGSEVKFDSPTADEIIPQFLSECKIGETYYALPYMRSTEACYVNKTFVEALGYELPEVLTWDFVWEVSAAAAKKDEDGTYLLNGQKVMIPFLYKSTDNMMIQSLRQLGADYSTDEGDILIFNDTTKKILQDVAKSVELDAFSTFKISSYPANFLNAGQCVFAVDSTAGATWMGSNAPLSDISEDKLVQFETAVYPIPQYDPENPKMISQGPSVCVFNKDDPNEVLASWLFTQFLLSDEVQIAYAQTEGYVPVTSKAQNTEEYKTYLENEGIDDNLHYDVKIKASKLLLENLDNTFVTPVFNGSASLRDAAGQMIENVTKSVNRKQEINDEYFEKLYSDIESLYRLDSLETGVGASQKELGELPKASKILISVLIIVWILMIIYVIIDKLRAKRKN